MKTPWYWSTGIEVARSCFYVSRRKRTLFLCKTFVSFLRGILPIILACIASFAVSFVFSSNPPSLFQCSEDSKNECWDSRGLKGNGSERVDTWECRKGLVSTVLKWRTVWGDVILTSKLFASNFFIYDIPEPYNVWEQLFNVMSERQAIPECPQHYTAFCNSFYSLPTPSGGVTSTLVLHPLDLITIMFQGKMLGITWLCVTCKCIATLNV